jgi:hypothetical protein
MLGNHGSFEIVEERVDETGLQHRRAIDRMVSDEVMRAHATRLRREIRSEHGVARAVRLIEQTFAGASPPDSATAHATRA